MAYGSKYQAKLPDINGNIFYTEEEHKTWSLLFKQQYNNINHFACDEYLIGYKKLALSPNTIPQLATINEKLKDTTGWCTQAVPALISFKKFFKLLATKHFPVATFIRTPNEIEYLQEPDIFHEIYGHCPLLTNPYFAQFSENYGKLGLELNDEDRVFLARLYWFTVEFGLLYNQNRELKIYGGGILSSPKETLYALSNEPKVYAFNLLDILRTPYRIDIVQPIYYVLPSIEMLSELTEKNIIEKMGIAKKMGLFSPQYRNN